MHLDIHSDMQIGTHGVLLVFKRSTNIRTTNIRTTNNLADASLSALGPIFVQFEHELRKITRIIAST